MGIATDQSRQLLAEVICELEAARSACFVVDADLRLAWGSPELHAMLRAARGSWGTASTSSMPWRCRPGSSR
jgi:hypothetical protein